MTPPPVTEADRKLAREVVGLCGECPDPGQCQECAIVTLRVASLLSSQREEHCRAVCRRCAQGFPVTEFTNFQGRRGFYHFFGLTGEDPCAASSIRSLSLPEPPAKVLGTCQRDSKPHEFRGDEDDLCLFWVALEPHKPEPHVCTSQCGFGTCVLLPKSEPRRTTFEEDAIARNESWRRAEPPKGERG